MFVIVQMADRKAVVKNADMSEDMQQDAVDCATQALEKVSRVLYFCAQSHLRFDLQRKFGGPPLI